MNYTRKLGTVMVLFWSSFVFAQARFGDIEVTSDTKGVDFGPYLQRVQHDVKQHWYAVIPESARPPLRISPTGMYTAPSTVPKAPMILVEAKAEAVDDRASAIVRILAPERLPNDGRK